MIGRTVLGRHRIVRALAKGGMGVVYLARSEGASGFTKPVVVKRMASDLMVDDSMARMFVREARLMSRLRHPGLVQVIDFGQERGDYLMVIEYVHGYHLGQWNRYWRTARGPFSATLLIHVVAQVLDALHYAHTLVDSDGQPLHIVHRDVSPSNILVDVDGHVKLADFGVARSTEQTEQTDQSTIKGKMPYLAPELFRLEEPSANTDAYACAVVLHEILTGQNEFRAADVATTVSRVLEHTPTPVDALRDDLPDGLGDVVARALAKNPNDRYQNANDLAKALRAVRPVPEEEADIQLRDACRADFTHPTMRSTIRFPSLAEREDAWQNPPQEIVQDDDLAGRLSSSPPTVAARPEQLDAQPVEPARRRWPWVAATVLLVGAAAAGAAFAIVGNQTRPTVDSQPTFVVVQSGQTGDRDAEPGGENLAADAGGEPDAGPAEEAPVTAMGGAGGTKATNRRNIAAPFARRRGEVMACLQRHSGADAPESIEVGFEVATDGRVVSATVRPASVQSTPLGTCVLAVARSTRFGPQPAVVRFRIPVRVRVQ